MYLKKVILTCEDISYKVTCDHRVGIIWYGFKAHSFPPVKDFLRYHNFLDIDIMGGRLTPEGQPLDKAINKVFKGYFRNLYTLYSLTSHLNSKIISPIAHNSKIISTWIV